MPRNKATTIELDLAIAEYVSRGEKSQARVHADLVRRGLITIREDGGFTVSDKTVGRRIREFEPADASGAWSFVDADPDEARLVLDVLLWALDWTDGRIWLTKDLAGWVTRVRKAAPAIPAPWAYVFAWGYRRAHAGKDADTRFLDLSLAAALWDRPYDGDSWRDRAWRKQALAAFRSSGTPYAGIEILNLLAGGGAGGGPHLPFMMPDSSEPGGDPLTWWAPDRDDRPREPVSDPYAPAAATPDDLRQAGSAS